MQVQFLGQEDTLEKEMATHSCPTQGYIKPSWVHLLMWIAVKQNSVFLPQDTKQVVQAARTQKAGIHWWPSG